MLKLKNVVIVLIALLLILGIGMQVMATDSTIDLDNLGDLLNNTNSTNTTDTTNIVTNTASENEVANEVTNTAGTIVQPEANEEDTSSENDLPQTGVTEDITVMFFIVVCVIAAIYAYKKIRDYKS